MRIDRPFVLLAMILFTDTFGYAIVLPLLPLAATRLGAGPLMVGAIFASYSVCQLLAAPQLGAVSDRVGRRPVLVASQLGSAAGFALMLIPGAVWALVLSRVVDGATAGNVSTVNAAVLDRYPPERWGALFAYLGAATGLGLLAGIAVSALLAAHGLAAAATVALLLALVSAVLVLVALPETARRQTASGWLESWKPVLRGGAQNLIARALATRFLGTAMIAAFVLTLPVFFFRRLGYGATETAPILVLLIGLGAAFQVALAPRLLTLWGPRGLVLAGFGAATVGALALTVVGPAWGVVAAAGLTICGIAAIDPSITALVGSANPELERGALMGLNQSLVSAGQVVGPMVGYAALASGPAAFGVVSAGLAVAGAAFTLRSEDRHART